MNKIETVSCSNSKVNIQDLALNGLLIALVFVATLCINIRLPISINGGLIHLGNVPLFIAAIVFNEKKGAIAGAFGMGLFDILGGWLIWAPFTFVIRGVMGYIVGKISKQKEGNNVLLNLAAMIIGGIWMIFGYYVSEVILYGNWVAPLTSIPGDVIQVVIAIIISLPLIAALKKIIKY